MSIEPWFPINYEFSEGLKLHTFRTAGIEWQLYDIDHRSRALICRSALGERWISECLLDPTSLIEIGFGDATYLLIKSGSNQHLAPVTEFNLLRSKADAAAFAVSMQQTRKIIQGTSFHDAIHVERLSRLLPTWTVSEKVSDEQVLGQWLTGGVAVSTSSFRRMTSLLGWLDESDIRDVIQLAGLDVPRSIGVNLSKELPHKISESDPQDEKLVHPIHQADAREQQKQLVSKFELSGRTFLEEFFVEHVIDIILNEKRYKALGVQFPSAIVLHGPPGCGKTFAVERLVEFLDWPIYHIDSNSVGSPYIHETSRKVSEVFEKAVDNAPAAIVIDEMESFLSDRQLLNHLASITWKRLPNFSEKFLKLHLIEFL